MELLFIVGFLTTRYNVFKLENGQISRGQSCTLLHPTFYSYGNAYTFKILRVIYDDINENADGSKQLKFDLNSSTYFLK